MGTTSSEFFWLAAAPDVPRWVEVRSILLSGEGRVLGTPEAGFVIDGSGGLAGMMGRPGKGLLEEALELMTPDADILVVPEGVDHVRSLIPSRTPLRAILHLREQLPGEDPDPSVEVALVDDRFLAGLPSELAEEVEDAHFAAVSRAEGKVVAACGAFSVTETLWDVGIDTLPEFRRQGHARRCFIALDARMTRDGLRPVWGAYEDNAASLGVASSLGFEPVDELWVIEL